MKNRRIVEFAHVSPQRASERGDSMGIGHERPEMDEVMNFGATPSDPRHNRQSGSDPQVGLS